MHACMHWPSDCVCVSGLRQTVCYERLYKRCWDCDRLPVCVCVCVMNSGSWSLKVSFNMARQADRGSVHMRMFVCTMQSNAAMKTQHVSLGDCCMTINKAVCFRTNTTYWWCMFTGNQVIITSNKVSLGYLDKNRLEVNMKLHSQAILLLQCDAFWGETGYSESDSVN